MADLVGQPTARLGRRVMVVITVAYWAAGLALLPLFWYRMGPDGVSYVSIAEKYAAGNLTDAVNAYWGPLYSWLMAPWLAAGIPRFAVVRFVLLGLGYVAVLGVVLLSRRFELDGRVRRAAVAACVPMALYFGFNSVTPDLLLTCVLAFYFWVILAPGFPERRGAGALCGVLGALAYFSKAFGFPFFVVSFLVLGGLHAWRAGSRERRVRVIRAMAAGFAVFGLVAGAWVAVVSVRCGELTIGTAGRHNFALVGPDAGAYAAGRRGLAEPPNASAVSSMENPARRLGNESWHPVRSARALGYELRRVVGNAGSAAARLSKMSAFAAPVLLAYVVLVLAGWGGVRGGRRVLPLAAAAVYVTGVVLTIVESRYLWPISLVLLLMTAEIATELVRMRVFAGWRAWLVIAVFVASFAVSPLSGLADKAGQEDLHREGDALRAAVAQGSRVASHGDRKGTLYLCFYLKARYYGDTEENPPENLEKELSKFRIDYFLVWGERPAELGFLEKYRRIEVAGVEGLGVYDLNAQR